MRHNMTVNELVNTLTAQASEKRDYVVPTSVLTLTPDGTSFLGANGGGRTLTDYCHRQVGTRLGIHASYYDKMRQTAPELLARNVNHWFTAKPEKRMIRTLGTSARAYLSDRFLPLDYLPMLEPSLPKMAQMGMEIQDCCLTEKKMYLKAIMPRMIAEIKKGDIVQAGMILGNSEVGDGALFVYPFVRRCVCDNGMIIDDAKFRKLHIGRLNQFGLGEDDGRSAFVKPETYKATVRAIMLTLQDVIDAVMDGTIFQRAVDKMIAATANAIPATVVDTVITEVTTKWRIGETDSKGILGHLIAGGDLSQWGLLNAVTRQAAEVQDAEESIRFERIGGEILDMTAKQVAGLWA